MAAGAFETDIAMYVLQDGESPDQALQRYCDELESTAVWGGQLELSVLSQVGNPCDMILPDKCCGVTHHDDLQNSCCSCQNATGMSYFDER